MRLTTIRTEGGTAAARGAGDVLEVLDYPDVRALLETGSDWCQTAEAGTVATIPITSANFAPLVPSPEKVLCVGLNYRDHAAEAKMEIPDFPMIFGKYANSLTGPYDEIDLPPNSDQVDWEVELGVVIGQPARDVDLDGARAAVAGFTILNDVSMRDWQMRTSQVMQGKMFEASTPVGPFLVTPDELPADLSMRLTCTVDDEIVQDGATTDLIFSPFELVSYLSEILTLVPGDLIATGTPAGIGLAMDPPRFIGDGSTLRSSIDGLGEQRNLFRTPV